MPDSVISITGLTEYFAIIRRYVDTEKPYDCCGSLKVEGSGICLLKKLTGTDPNTLMGLPLLRLIDMLENEGVNLPV